MLSITTILALIALVLTLASGLSARKPPLWIAVLFLCLALLVGPFIR